MVITLQINKYRHLIGDTFHNGPTLSISMPSVLAAVRQLCLLAKQCHRATS